MKRINPQTQMPFKRGDMRADGYLFNNYASTLKKDGYYKEVWLTNEVLKRRKLADTKRKMQCYVKKSTRFPKGTRDYFKKDPFAQMAYKKAIAYINKFPDYTMERLREITVNAPYILKVIFPTEAKPDYKAIFEEAKNVPMYGY